MGCVVLVVILVEEVLVVVVVVVPGVKLVDFTVSLSVVVREAVVIVVLPLELSISQLLKRRM